MAAPATGLGYSAVSVGGIAMMLSGSPDDSDIPRTSEGQRFELGALVVQSAGFLSARDAFLRAVPAMQQQGKYKFLTTPEGLPELLSAPFDFRFLKRWTTWVDIGQTALMTGLVLSERTSSKTYYPYRVQDGAVVFGIAANAGISEEAMFRGYLLPMIYEKSGKFWVANATQAAIFGIGHGPAGLLFQGPWGLWEGWLVRRNDWSIRESIFHHFWYDFAVITAAAVVEAKPVSVRVRLPSISF